MAVCRSFLDGVVIFFFKGGHKHFYTEMWESLYLRIGGGYDDVDVGEEKDVSGANILASEAQLQIQIQLS